MSSLTSYQTPSFMLVNIILPRWQMALSYDPDPEIWHFLAGMLHMLSLVYNQFDRDCPVEDLELLRDIAKQRGRDAEEKRKA